MFPKVLRCLAISILAALVIIFAACGGGQTAPNATSFARVTISDPPTCASSTGGPYRSVYVTITDVLIHTSSTAADNDAGWVDLTPNLKNAPIQIDLLGMANPQCFLASLGAAQQLQPGTYQQIRVVLADTNATVTNNRCGNVGPHCVILAGDLAGVDARRLELSSQAKNGLKIPSGQIAGGKFVIAPGETKDLNIDFNTCASIVQAGNGKYHLKPVLHAGDVTLTANSINGRLVDATTQAPITGKAIVLLESKDTEGIDRVIMQTTPDANGWFTFCPVMGDGPFEVVAVSIDETGSTTAFGPTVISGVRPGAAIGVVPVAATIGTSTAAATITGNVTAVPNAADVQINALQKVTIGGTEYTVTVPLALQSNSLLRITTASGGSCASGSTCGTYSVVVPAQNATTGSFIAAGTTYNPGTAGTVNYLVEGLATAPGTTTATCSPSKQTTAPITVTPGATANAPALSFTGCTAQ